MYSYLIYPTVAITVFMVSFLWSNKIITWLYDKSLGQMDEIKKYMRLMFIEVNDDQLTKLLLSLSLGMGAIFFFLFWPNLIASTVFGVFFTVMGWVVPKKMFKYLYEQRCDKFVAQMVDATTILANGVKAGLSVTQAMDRVVKNQPNPISQEFRLVLSQNQLGQSVEDALNDLGERIPRPDVQMFVTAINILKETGGNLAVTFQTINYTIRERQKIEKKIEAMTAQGITQGIIVSCVPFFLLGMFYFMDPNYVMPLFTTTLGWIFLFIALALQVTGALMIRKLVNIKV